VVEKRSRLDLPAGYAQDFHLDINDTATMARLQWLGFVGLLAAIAAAALWHSVWRSLWIGPLLPLPDVVFFGLLIAVIPAHEWMHGIAIRWAGQIPRYGAKFVDVGRIKLPYLFYATTDGAYFYRDAFIIIALAPLIVLSILLAALTLISPQTAFGPIMAAFVINASGAVGDLWMMRETARYPADALVLDEADAIRIFTRHDASTA
jgi:hypothetical protein